MEAVGTSLANDQRRANGDREATDALVREGKAIERGMLNLTKRIKRINRLYNERLRNRTGPDEAGSDDT